MNQIRLISVSRAIGSLHCSDTQLIVVPAVYLSTDLCIARTTWLFLHIDT